MPKEESAFTGTCENAASLLHKKSKVRAVKDCLKQPPGAEVATGLEGCLRTLQSVVTL